MTQPRIDISPDATRPEGGYATILVHGLMNMPSSLTFKISALPEDPDDHEAGEEWSLGERKPLDANITPDGLALQVGPDIIDAAQLQPGTPITFTLPAAGVCAELSWPDLPVTIPDKLAAPIIDPSDLRAQKIEQRRREAEEAAEKAERAAEAEALRLKAASEASAKASPVLNLADVSAAAAIAEPAPIEPVTSAPKVLTNKPPMPEHLSATTKPPMPEHLSATTTTQPDDKTGDRVAVSGPIAAPLRSPARELPAAHEITTTQDRAHWSKRHWLSIALAIIALPAMLLALWPTQPVGSNMATLKSGLEQLVSSDWVTRILAVGNRSPGGFDASNVTADEALKKAEQAIFSSDGKPNIAERKFWLRKSITLLLAEPQSRWAVTQLGALHTASRGEKKKPNYRSAKTLWELASASGDTVATCFLAQLYELGLGVIASPERARKWQKRAAGQGGCNLLREGRPEPVLTN